MKRLLFISLCTIATLCTSQAKAWQKRMGIDDDVDTHATIGLKGGVQAQYLSGNNPWNRSFGFGPLAGAYLSIYHKRFGGRIEAVGRGVRYHSTQTGNYVQIVNFDVPVLIEFHIIREIKIHLGGQISSFAVVDDKSGNDSKSNFTTIDPSFVVGAEGDLPFHLLVGARFVKGLLSINDSPKRGEWFTTSAQLYVGYSFAR